jgi:hypothetical protein
MIRMSLPASARLWNAKFDAYKKEIDALPEPKTTGDVTAIVLSYKRPANIEPIIRALLKSPSIARIVLSNHNPAIPSASLFPKSHPRVTVVEHPHRDSYYRYAIAATLPGDRFLAIDDDVFLLPSQIETVCHELSENPRVPHGVCCQFRRKNGSFISGIVRYEGETDVINRVYAFTKTHAQKVVASHDARWSDGENCMWDDILVSFSGEGRPQCHDVGDILFCPTSRKSDVALCRRGDFSSKREAAFRELSAARS